MFVLLVVLLICCKFVDCVDVGFGVIQGCFVLWLCLCICIGVFCVDFNLIC